MAIDNAALKARLAKMQAGSGGNFEKIDYKAVFFKPVLGKQTIRIVPSKFNPDVHYKDVAVHNFNVFKKTIYALSNWDEKDPIEQMRKILFKSEDEDEKAIAKKLSIKHKAFFNVIVRGQEENGVRLWEVGPQTLEKILIIMTNEEEYGDITDIVEGTDLVVDGITATFEGSKKTYIDVNITPKRKTSTLSDDPDQVEKWLEDQKDPLELQKHYTYDEIKELLGNFLNPKDSDEDDETPVPKKAAIVKGKAVVKPTLDEDDEEPVVTKPKAKAKAVPVVEEDEDDEEPVVVKPKVKAKAKPVVEDIEEEDEETPPVKAKTATKAKKAPVVDLVDDEDDGLPFTVDEDEEEELPVVKKKATTAPAKPAGKSTVAAKFAAVFDDDED